MPYGSLMTSTANPSRAQDASERPAPASGPGRRWLAGRVFLGYAIAVSLIPVSPLMPISGVDGSWAVALNRATAEGLQFGRDIVFTYGPYSGVLTGVYEPGIRVLVMTAALVLAAGWITAALLVLRSAATWVHVLAGVVVLVLTFLSSQGPDTLETLYPLLVVFATTQLPARRGLRLVAVAVLAAPFGLLVETKLSVVPAIVAAVVVGGFLLLRRRDRLGALVLLLTPAVSVLVGWVAAHQSIAGLLDYVRGSLYVMAGYSEAMSLHETSLFPRGVVTLTFVLVSAIIVAVGLTGRRDLDWLLQVAMVALTLFLAFKTSFVRADGHMQTGALVLLTTGLLVARGIPARPSRRQRITYAVVMAYAVAGATACYLSNPLPHAASDLRRATIGIPSDVVRGDVSSSALHRRYDAAMSSIRRKDTVPTPQGSSDLYTSSLILLFAQGADWDPRPVIQSYAAYTPELAEMNAEHLRGPSAPQTLIVQLGPIDERLVALEDGASYVPMLEHYDVMPETSSDHLVLGHRAQPRPVSVGDESHVLRGRLGARLRIPQTSTNWLASFDVRPTLAGRIRNALWKPPQMNILIRTADGASHVRRFIPAMAHGEFVLSPYIGDTTGLRSLFPGQPAAPPGLQVRSISLTVGSHGGLFWNHTYTLRLRSFDVTQ